MFLLLLVHSFFCVDAAVDFVFDDDLVVLFDIAVIMTMLIVGLSAMIMMLKIKILSLLNWMLIV